MPKAKVSGVSQAVRPLEQTRLGLGCDRLFLQTVEDIRRKRDPGQNDHPHASGEDVVVIKKFAPGMARNIMPKQELKSDC